MLSLGANKMKKLSCCLPILYIWLMAHIGDNVMGIRCLIELVTRRKLEMRGAKEWAQCFAGLNKRKSYDNHHGNKEGVSFIVVLIFLMFLLYVQKDELTIIQSWLRDNLVIRSEEHPNLLL